MDYHVAGYKKIISTFCVEANAKCRKFPHMSITTVHSVKYIGHFI